MRQDTSSRDGASRTVDVTLPVAWHQLDDRQLLYAFDLMAAGVDFDELRAYCFFRWGKIPSDTRIPPLAIAEALSALDWMGLPPERPVRVSVIDGHQAVAADFDGVPLEKFIVCDNLYQGYLQRRDDGFLRQMATVLYDAPDIRLTPGERFGVMMWFTSLKDWLSRRFAHFFRPAGAGESGGGSLRDSVDAMIRALTKGDVTKEREILGIDTLRALTELNAQAREYEEMRRQLKK